MGIKRLYTFTIDTGIAHESTAEAVLQKREKAGRPIRSIGIDMSNLIQSRLHAAHKRNTPKSYNSDSGNRSSGKSYDSSYVEKTSRIGISEVAGAQWDVITAILGLLEMGITPVPVFDGKAPYTKKSEVDAQKERRNNAISTINENISKIKAMDSDSTERQKLEQDVTRLKSKYLNCPMNAIYDIAEILGILNITCIWANSEVQDRAQYMRDNGYQHPVYAEDKEGEQGRCEADSILATLYPEHIDAILTSDTDFLAMGCDIIIQRIVYKTSRGRDGKEVKFGQMNWTFIEAHRVWDQFGFSLHPLIPRTTPVLLPNDEDEFLSLNTARDDTVKVSDLRKKFGVQSMRELHMLRHKMVLTCSLASCPGINMRKPSLGVAARAAEEGRNIQDAVAYIDKIITEIRKKRRCQRCCMSTCICERYGNEKTTICTMMAYLTFIRLPFEYQWFRHVCKTRTQWLHPSVPNSAWSLMSSTCVDGNIRNTKSIRMRIGSILPTNRIDIELFKKRLPIILPNMLMPQDMQALLGEIEALNVNIANGIYWNEVDINDAESVMNEAVYAQHMLPKSFGMSVQNAGKAFSAIFIKQQSDANAKKGKKYHASSSSASDISPSYGAASLSPASTLDTSMSQFDLTHEATADTESFCSSISSLDDSAIP